MSGMRSLRATTPVMGDSFEAAVGDFVQCMKVRHRAVALRLSNLRASRRGYT